MNIEQIFRKFERQNSKVLEADGGFLPAPPSAAHPGNHLHFNCRYTPPINENPDTLLDEWRNCACEVIRLLKQNLDPTDYLSVCFSMYGDMEPEQPVRLYRTLVKKSNFEKLESTAFTELVEGEQSFYPPVKQILNPQAG